jgi:hypothetical protein
VALSFLNTIPSPLTSSSDKFPTTSTTTTTTTSTTTIFPFIDTNLIKRPIEHIPYSGKHNIKWKKDGKDLPKDIKINLRFVCDTFKDFCFSLLFCYVFWQTRRENLELKYVLEIVVIIIIAEMAAFKVRTFAFYTVGLKFLDTESSVKAFLLKAP